MQLAIRTSINWYRLIPLAIMLWPAANAVADYALKQLPLRQLTVANTTMSEPVYLSKGDTVAGYKVSSGYDLARVHPVRGTVEPHYGVDLATPVGTKLIAPTTIEVRCWYDTKGGGEVAVVDEKVQLLHLSTCVAGKHSREKPLRLLVIVG